MLLHERDSQSRKWKVVIGLLLASIIIGIVHNRYAVRGKSDPVSNTVRTVTSPAVRFFGSAGSWIGDQTNWIFQGKRYAEENRRLHAENDRLSQELAQLREADITSRRLKEQIGFATTLEPKKIAATVIAYRPNQSLLSLAIDRGSKDGITPQAAVTAAKGLIGQVFDVGLTTSAVLLLSDPVSSVGIMVQRPESRAFGVCKGKGGDLLEVRYLTMDADIKPGDTVITSGLGGKGGVYPKGIPVGEVIAVRNDQVGSGKVADVRPFVRFDRLEEAYVLK